MASDRIYVSNQTALGRKARDLATHLKEARRLSRELGDELLHLIDGATYTDVGIGLDLKDVDGVATQASGDGQTFYNLANSAKNVMEDNSALTDAQMAAAVGDMITFMNRVDYHS